MITLSVPDMTCGHCKASVEAALRPLGSAVSIDLTARRVTLDKVSVSDAAIAALDRIGFPASRVTA